MHESGRALGVQKLNSATALIQRQPRGLRGSPCKVFITSAWMFTRNRSACPYQKLSWQTSSEVSRTPRRDALDQTIELRTANEHTASSPILRAFGSPLRSGSFPSVKVMQAADLWNLDHVTEQGRLDGSAERCIFFERQMCTATFVQADNLIPIVRSHERSIICGIRGVGVRSGFTEKL